MFIALAWLQRCLSSICRSTEKFTCCSAWHCGGGAKPLIPKSLEVIVTCLTPARIRPTGFPLWSFLHLVLHRWPRRWRLEVLQLSVRQKNSARTTPSSRPPDTAEVAGKNGLVSEWDGHRGEDGSRRALSDLSQMGEKSMAPRMTRSEIPAGRSRGGEHAEREWGKQHGVC